MNPVPSTTPIRRCTAPALTLFAASVLLLTPSLHSQNGSQSGTPTDSDAYSTPGNSQAQNSPSQSSQTQNSSSHDRASHDSGSTDLSPSAMEDRIFIRHAAAGGLAEVKLGQLAATKGGSDEVRQFGEHMVTDHTELNQSLKTIAESRGIMVPSRLAPPDEALYQRLNQLSGDDFDREYIKAMAADHRKDLHEFRAEAASTQDSALRDAAQKGSALIRQHMTTVHELARARNIETGAPQVRASNSQ